MKPTKKTTAKKAAPKRAAAAKKPAVKTPAPKKAAPAVKKAPAAKVALSPEERYRMIQDTAYYIAERHGFNGDSAYFWSLAEAEINDKLS
jgi:hypothetical protein